MELTFCKEAPIVATVFKRWTSLVESALGTDIVNIRGLKKGGVQIFSLCSPDVSSSKGGQGGTDELKRAKTGKCSWKNLSTFYSARLFRQIG